MYVYMYDIVPKDTKIGNPLNFIMVLKGLNTCWPINKQAVCSISSILNCFFHFLKLIHVHNVEDQGAMYCVHVGHIMHFIL